jgi:deoxyribonuclease-4
MPLRSITGGALLGYDPSSLTEFYRRIPVLEFCFDISHAIKAAISLRKDYLAFITEFLAFKKPFVVHLAGSTLDTEFDTHLHLEQGQYDIPAIKQILLHLQYTIHLTLETPKRYENKLEDDLRNIRFFLEC